jgi:hypothetical protein
MKNCMVVDLNSVFGTKHTDVQGAQYLLHEKRTIRKLRLNLYTVNPLSSTPCTATRLVEITSPTSKSLSILLNRHQIPLALELFRNLCLFT